MSSLAKAVILSGAKNPCILPEASPLYTAGKLFKQKHL
jgi:hypothetical protein